MSIEEYRAYIWATYAGCTAKTPDSTPNALDVR